MFIPWEGWPYNCLSKALLKMKEVLLMTTEQRYHRRSDVMFNPFIIRKYLSKLQWIQFVNYYDYIDL